MISFLSSFYQILLLLRLLYTLLPIVFQRRWTNKPTESVLSTTGMHSSGGPFPLHFWVFVGVRSSRILVDFSFCAWAIICKGCSFLYVGYTLNFSNLLNGNIWFANMKDNAMLFSQFNSLQDKTKTKTRNRKTPQEW